VSVGTLVTFVVYFIFLLGIGFYFYRRNVSIEDLMAEGWALWRQRKLAEAEKKFKAAAKKDQTNDGVYQGLYLAEVVVFCDGFGDVPGAVEVLGEDDKVARAETDRIVAIGDGYLSLQQQAGFLFSI
jgi:hypothetical protein